MFSFTFNFLAYFLCLKAAQSDLYMDGSFLHQDFSNERSGSYYQTTHSLKHPVGQKIVLLIQIRRGDRFCRLWKGTVPLVMRPIAPPILRFQGRATNFFVVIWYFVFCMTLPQDEWLSVMFLVATVLVKTQNRFLFCRQTQPAFP